MAFVSPLVFILLVIAGLAIQAHCYYGLDYSPGSSANLSTVWRSASQPQDGILYAVDPMIISPTHGNHDLIFVASFYCANPCNSYVFGIAILSKWSFQNLYSVFVVWSANYDHQVLLNATLNFTSTGDLVLRDADNSLVWSTNTSGQSVAWMTINELGNLVLFDQNNRSVWQSFDHPTDTLLPRQPLLDGMTLRPNSFTDWTTSNKFYFTVLSGGLYAYAGSAQQ